MLDLSVVLNELVTDGEVIEVWMINPCSSSVMTVRGNCATLKTS